MFSAKATCLLIIYCLAVHAAVLPSVLGPSATAMGGATTTNRGSSSGGRPQVTFQRLKSTGGSIWKTIFAHSKPVIKCPFGSFLQSNRCVVGSTSTSSSTSFPSKVPSFLTSLPTSSAARTGVPPRRLLLLDQIRSYIWPWYNTPIGENLSGGTTPGPSQTVSEDPYQICKLKVYDFSNPTEDLVNIDNNADVLYPGSFVQSRYVSTGAESLVGMGVGDNVRQPISLASSDGNFAPFDVVNPTAGKMRQAIKNSVLAASGFSSGIVYYDLMTSDSIEQLVIDFNFNAKILEKIDLKGGFNGNWQTKKSKYILTMIQKITSYFPDTVVRTPGQLGDAIGYFLKNEFDLTYANNLKQSNYWGPNNPPLYVSQVYYGRMLIVTVDKNQYTSSIYAQIQASSATASGDLAVTFTKLFQDASKKIFSIGPFSEVDINQLTSGIWKNFFEQIPSDSPMVQALKPIGFRLKDWMTRPVKVSNMLQYNKLICDPKPPRKIEVRILYAYDTASIQVRKAGEDQYKPIKMDQEGGDITAHLSNGDNDIRIQSTVGKPNGFSRFQRKVTIQVLINGVTKYGPATNQCKGCHSTKHKEAPIAAFRCRKVNKYVGDPECENLPNP